MRRPFVARGPFCLAVAGLLLALSSAGMTQAYQPHTVVTLTKSISLPTGNAVANAGDLNRDGYADVVFGSSVGGRGVYVLLGGAVPDSVPDLTMWGTAPSADWFGSSVGGAGDVNGDGYADLIVGAANAGYARIYFGGAVLDTVADVVLTSPNANSAYGCSVAGAGDINRDGFADVVVGASSDDTGVSNAGRAYLYLGGAAMDATADVIITGVNAGDLMGYSVSGAGDVNGDTYADFIVGMPQYVSPKAYIYFGGSVPNGGADVVLQGSNNDFGQSVAGIGDFNGDGYGDVAVGNPQACTVSLYWGATYPDATADLTFAGEALSQFGLSCAGAGDVNGDGRPDVVVGAPYYSSTGRAYVYYGGTAPDAASDIVLTGKTGYGRFGYSVSGGGDFDGDGSPDLVVGAPSGNVGTQAHVISPRPFNLLAPNGNEQWVAGTTQTVRWLGQTPADLWISVGGEWTLFASGAGGLESNALAVPAPDQPATGVRVRVSANGEAITRLSSDVSAAGFSIVARHAPPRSTARTVQTFTGAASSDYFGRSASDAGDVNNDRYADFIVGAPFNDAAGSNAGRAYLHLGGAAVDAVADVTFTGLAAGDFLGTSVSSAGDVNGDGYADVIVGASGAGGTGRVYVYYGGPAMDALADLTFNGAAASDQFGISVSGAGDFNRDGYADMIVGAPTNDAGGSDAGRAYIYFGGFAPDAVADVVLTGEAAGDQFGISVSNAGDVSGDGFADVIVGAYLNDFAGSNAGRAWVYYGGSPANNVADRVLTGETAAALFGRSVSNAGDVNGDGFGDFLVGATAQPISASAAGRAYLYFGGTASTVADLTFSAIGTDDLFGFSPSGVGDVNDDGYADFIVGSYSSDAGGADAGRAYLYFGGPGLDAIPDHVFTGAAIGDNFGYAASGAGDVTGDGVADLLIGAQANDAAGADAGRVYLYDFDRYVLTAPNGGELWNVGGTQTVTWLGGVRADLWLSSDNGATYTLLRADIGGEASNQLALRVPHVPSRFARMKLTPHDPAIRGIDESDSSFTIRTSVTLLSLVADLGAEGGAEVRWASEPAVSPDGLAGYRLYRLDTAEGPGVRLGPDLITENRYVDAAGGRGTRYRLTALNGLGGELELGRVAIAGPPAALRAWPSPVASGGTLRIELAAPWVPAGVPATDLDVALFDLAGRRVATLARSALPGREGVISLAIAGARLPGAGLYFVRAAAASAGYAAERRIVILP